MPARNRGYDHGLSRRELDQRGGRYDNGLGANDREFGRSRPWVGGYNRGFEGGSEGISVNTAGYGRDAFPSGQGGGGERGRRGGRDLWWLGYHGYDEQYRPGRYEQEYRDFHEQNRPRFSPIGGMQMGMGGEYMRRGAPRPLAYDRWFSDWTRWF